jgi:hypothetical protein
MKYIRAAYAMILLVFLIIYLVPFLFAGKKRSRATGFAVLSLFKAILEDEDDITEAFR